MHSLTPLALGLVSVIKAHVTHVGNSAFLLVRSGAAYTGLSRLHFSMRLAHDHLLALPSMELLIDSSQCIPKQALIVLTDKDNLKSEMIGIED